MERISDEDLPVTVRWGVGGAIAQKFAAHIICRFDN